MTMRIKQITWQMRNDFKAIMVCEHCGHESENNSGYHDAFYHARVIPAMRCGACGKDSAGNTEHTDQAVSPVVAA